LGKLVQQIGTFGENVWANWFSKLVLLVKMFGQIGFNEYS
jgi:hypothetical protein